jgi:hypothetical protein
MVKRKRLSVCRGKVLKHLEGDKNTWYNIAYHKFGTGSGERIKKIALKEAKSDEKLIKYLKRVK